MITGKRADRIIIDDPGYDPAASRLWLRNAVQKVIVKRAVADWWRDHNQPKPHGITVSVAGQPLVEGCDFTISGSTVTFTSSAVQPGGTIRIAYDYPESTTLLPPRNRAKPRKMHHVLYPKDC